MIEQPGKFRKIHYFTALQPLKTGEDNIQCIVMNTTAFVMTFEIDETLLSRHQMRYFVEFGLPSIR